MLTVHSAKCSTYSLHMQGGLSNPFISGEKKKAIHSQQIPFCHGNLPSRPSSTTVVHRGCLKQDNKTKPLPIQPWHFLLGVFWAGITQGWGREGVNGSFCPLTSLGASHLCPSMGPISGVGCPVPLELSGETVTVTMSWKQRTKRGTYFLPSYAKERVLACQSPCRGWGREKQAPCQFCPNLEGSALFSAVPSMGNVSMGPTAAGHQHNSHQFGGRQLSWPPPAILG